MNPDTNKFEPLVPAGSTQADELAKKLGELQKSPLLLRPDGTPVPKHWTQFKLGEHVVIKDYTFCVAYIGESAILFEPVGPLVVGESPP